jgi:hypothetical protein
MKPLFDFLVKLCILSVILWAVILFGPVSGNIQLPAVFLAWILVAANTVGGYLLFEYAFEKDSAVFTKVVFGGVAVRLLILMIAVAVVLVGKMVDNNQFVFSLFAFYCSYVILEILGYQKKNKLKKNAA